MHKRLLAECGKYGKDEHGFNKGAPPYHWDFFPEVTSFQEAVAKLPESPDRNLLNDFANAAKAAFHMERASRLYSRCIDLEKPDTEITKGLAWVKEAGEFAKFSEADISLMQDAYLRGEVEKNYFWPKIMDMWKSDSDAQPGLNKQISRSISFTRKGKVAPPLNISTQLT